MEIDCSMSVERMVLDEMECKVWRMEGLRIFLNIVIWVGGNERKGWVKGEGFSGVNEVRVGW